jgi:hypothetical protein
MKQKFAAILCATVLLFALNVDSNAQGIRQSMSAITVQPNVAGAPGPRGCGGNFFIARLQGSQRCISCPQQMPYYSSYGLCMKCPPMWTLTGRRCVRY